jgi:hypothetical protein
VIFFAARLGAELPLGIYHGKRRSGKARPRKLARDLFVIV